MLLSEQMRYPPSANLSQVQTLFQNCLHTAFWYASITSYIFDRQSRILFDHNLYSSDVSLGNRGFRPFSLPGRVSSTTENFPALKALIHLKTVRIEMVWGPYVPHNSLNICFESILSLMLTNSYEFQSSGPCSNVTSKFISENDCIYFTASISIWNNSVSWKAICTK